MLTKTVNGKEVICDAQEEAAIRAEWAAQNPALRKPSVSNPVLTIDALSQRIAVLEDKLGITQTSGK